jgi:hypothetical protein
MHKGVENCLCMAFPGVRGSTPKAPQRPQASVPHEFDAVTAAVPSKLDSGILHRRSTLWCVSYQDIISRSLSDLQMFLGLEVALFVASLAFLTVHKRSTTVNYSILIMTCLLCMLKTFFRLCIPSKSHVWVTVAGATIHFVHDAFGCVSIIKFFVRQTRL